MWCVTLMEAENEREWCVAPAAAVLMVCQHSVRVPYTPTLTPRLQGLPWPFKPLAVNLQGAGMAAWAARSETEMWTAAACTPWVPYPAPPAAKGVKKVCGPPSPPTSRECLAVCCTQGQPEVARPLVWQAPVAPAPAAVPTCMHHRAEPLAQKCFNRARLMAPSLPGT